jgi:hypothetical protein
MVDLRRFVCILPQGVKLRCHARPAGHEQQSTGLLHLIFESPSVLPNKKEMPQASLFYFLKGVGYEN